MSYIIISTRIRFEVGPTLCGDEQSDPELMSFLGAVLKQESGNPFKVYSSPDPPRVVLNKLSSIGYHVLTSCGAGQTCIWTLYKPPTETDTH